MCADCPRYRSADGLFRTLAARLIRRSRILTWGDAAS